MHFFKVLFHAQGFTLKWNFCDNLSIGSTCGGDRGASESDSSTTGGWSKGCLTTSYFGH